MCIAIAHSPSEMVLLKNQVQRGRVNRCLHEGMVLNSQSLPVTGGSFKNIAKGAFSSSQGNQEPWRWRLVDAPGWMRKKAWVDELTQGLFLGDSQSGAEYLQ